MKLIELFENIDEGVADIAKNGGKGIANTANAANAGIVGAGGPDAKAALKKYAGKTWDKNERGRGVGRNLPDDVRLRNIIRTEYNLEKVNRDDIYDAYKTALHTGDKQAVQKIIKDYKSYMVDNDLKKANKEALFDLLSQGSREKNKSDETL